LIYRKHFVKLKKRILGGAAEYRLPAILAPPTAGLAATTTLRANFDAHMLAAAEVRRDPGSS
jgi:hypothetical protein